MLITLTFYQHITNIKTEEKISMSTSGEMSIEKERKKVEKMKSKQILVRRDGALRGAASAYFLPSSQYS